MPKQKVNFTLDYEVIEALEQLSNQLNMSKSIILSNAILYYKDSSLIDLSPLMQVVRITLQDNFRDIGKNVLKDIRDKITNIDNKE